MKSKISSRKILLIIAIIAFLFLLIFIFNLPPRDLKEITKSDSVPFIEDAFASSKKEQINFWRPIRLKISKIKVDAAIKYVGVTSQGAMDIPKGPTEVAWFNLGPRPGEVGSAVISGHYGWKNNIPAVFDNLSKLKKGDRVSIKDEKGMLINFVVRESKIFGENDDASSVFGSNDGKAHLNLITCGGVWNKAKKSYSNRLVIFTDKEVK